MRHPGKHTAIPGPRGYPPWGVFLRLRSDPLRYLTVAARHYRGVVSLPLGVRQAFLLAHPSHIQHVLQDQPGAYRKGASVVRIKPLFGEGLTTSEGALWRRQRRLMQPLFQWPRLLPWTDIVTEATAAMVAHCEPFAARGQPIDLGAALRSVTRGIMHHVLFGPADGPNALARGAGTHAGAGAARPPRLGGAAPAAVAAHAPPPPISPGAAHARCLREPPRCRAPSLRSSGRRPAAEALRGPP